MFTFTLFKIGPYEVCILNLIYIALIYFASVLLRRIIHRNLKRILINQNIRVEGRRATLLRLLSQSVFVLSGYLIILSFRSNNPDVSFLNFLNYNLIESKFVTVSFAHIIGIIVVIFSAKFIVNLVKLYISRRVKIKSELDHGSEYIYIQVSKYVIYVFAIVICLQILNIDLTILLTGSVGLFVGLGLGLQDVFRDMVSGIILLFESNIKVGDVVEISNSGSSGPIIARINKINVRTSHIETRNGNVLIIPNSKLTQDLVENWSHGTLLSRYTVEVSVAYGSDTELVKKLLKQATYNHPQVDKQEPVLIRLKNFGDNGLEMEIIFWAEQSWEVNVYKSDIRFEIDRLFRENKITIPFPQRDIRMQNQ
jgi:small-conductance mechanosensitive channel